MLAHEAAFEHPEAGDGAEGGQQIAEGIQPGAEFGLQPEGAGDEPDQQVGHQVGAHEDEEEVALPGEKLQKLVEDGKDVSPAIVARAKALSATQKKKKKKAAN